MKKLISAIITPTWNNEDYTVRCFDSIRKNTLDYKIIWIDNGSTPESRRKVKNFLDENNVPYELIQNEENLGFVKATNQGMKRAMDLEAEYIVLQNNDTEVYEGWLKRMIEVAESDKKIGLVGPITSPCISWQSIQNLKNSHSEFFDLPEYENNPKEYSEIIKNKYRETIIESKIQIAFFCTLIKAGVVSKQGFLSEEFGVGFGDDDDYCVRALKSGWKIVVVGNVFVFHNHRTTFKSIYTEESIKDMLNRNAAIHNEKHKDFYEKIAKEKESDESLRGLRELVEHQQKEIELMKNSKCWRLRDIYEKAKFAIVSPYEFARKCYAIFFRIAGASNKQREEIRNKYYCNICRKMDYFGPFGASARPNAQCPTCGSVERHRFLYYIYQILFLNTDKKINLLHMSPEKCFHEIFAGKSNVKAVYADLHPENFEFMDCHRENFTSMSFADKYFDVILANQVLEHIEDEQKCLLEMKRCLRDDGCVIINIPFSPKLDETYEDADVKTGEERKKAYGQEDHVRLYGKDASKRLASAGFIVNQISVNIFPEDFISFGRLECDNFREISGGYFILKKDLS